MTVGLLAALPVTIPVDSVRELLVLLAPSAIPRPSAHLHGHPPALLVILFIVPSQVRQLVLDPEQVRHLLSHLAQS